MKVHIGPYRKNRRVDVRIDKYDTWSMDDTLALIVLPMLKQLNATKHGAPFVDDEDVPEELRSTSAPPKENDWDTDDNHFKRWDWVMAEMIFAFEQKCRDDWMDDYVIQEGELGESVAVEYEGEVMYEMTWRVPYIWDDAGRKAHQERMTNGFRLFGKYYEGLWD